ncbi:MAG: flavin-containing monooxygenase [Flavobacteriaceae bacterium]
MNINAPEAQSGLQEATRWLQDLTAALAARDKDATAALFVADGYWRDILALTFDIRTFAGAATIADAILGTGPAYQPAAMTLEAETLQAFSRKRIGPSIEAFFKFETEIAACRGHLRLRRDTDGRWRAWTLFTVIEELKGHEEMSGAHRPVVTAPEHGRFGEWLTADQHARKYEHEDPDTLVIGGAQTGLVLAARLGALGIGTLVIEKEPRVGDVWRNRYQSLVLHNQIWANHFPFMPFPTTWPVYITKDQLAEWLEDYQRAMSIAVWTSTTLTGSSYDEATGRWTVTLRRGDGTTRTLHPRNIVLATGVFGGPRRIEIPYADRFAGKIVYAAEYSGGDSVAGKRVLVVGSGSSAHDISQELNAQGAKVTMLQRGSTTVVSLEPGAAIPYAIYSEDGLPVEEADMISNSIPFPVLHELHKDMQKQIAELDRDLIAALNAKGFATDDGDEGSGFLMKFFRHGGGYYINVGTSDLIVNGQIAVHHGAEIAGTDGTTVEFSDGISAQFDMIVVACGYRNMQETVRDIFGSEVADKVGPIWGLDDEGELRNMWKRTGQRGFWIAGGSLQQNRSFSRYLALQIKAAAVGLV